MHRALVPNVVLLIVMALGPAAQAASIRLEGGLGGNVAVLFGDFDEVAETLTDEDDFLAGGIGLAGTLAAWLDTDVGVSLGLQGFADRAGLEIEIDDREFDGERDARGVMALIALRRVAGPHRPYVGLGAGYVWTDVTYEQREDDVLEIELDGDYGSPAGTVFGGYDYDLNDNVYLGVRLALRGERGDVDAVSAGSADIVQVTTSLTGQFGVRF